MESISLRNFRKFEKLDKLTFAPITVFVGENNSGKSTVVKSILTLRSFSNENVEVGGLSDEQIDIKDFRHPKLYFNKSYYAHIGSFYRAIYNKAKDDIITFEYETSEAIVKIEVKGNKEDRELTYGEITNITITNLKTNILFLFNFQGGFIRIFFNKNENRTYLNKLDKDDKKEYLESVLPYFKAMKEDEMLTISLDELLQEVQRTSQNYFTSMPMIVTYTNWASIAIKSNLGELYAQRTVFGSKFKVNIEGLNNYFISVLQKYSNILLGRGAAFNGQYLLNRIEYIYAHAVTQNVVYNAKDKGDYLVRTIHEFAEMHIPTDKSNKVYRFITHWMEEFNIGVGYKIHPFGGEALTVQIIQKDGTEVNLADKGMGAIQMMILLLRLAIYINNTKRFFIGNTIIIEEPEQNLHPMLQSKLAELLLKLYNDYKFKFIIETHSEYFIRKTQVIVADNIKKDANWANPFKVYYFRQNGIPYDMGYQKNGKFIESFETGFFDVSTKLSMDLLDLEDE